jgi:hypothetical protein
MAAQSCLGATLTAVVWHKPLRPWPASALFVLAIWICVLLPEEASLRTAMLWTEEPTHPALLLKIAAGLATLGIAVGAARWILAVAIAGEAALYWLVGTLTETDNELAALHLAWFGVLLGLHLLTMDRRPERPFTERELYGGYGRTDAACFTLAVVLAAIVSTVVLEHAIDSADEWGNTYQAAVFAKGRIYGKEPPCALAVQSYWVFWKEGRMFSQYTPGWPLFMVPFVWIRSVWLAGPFSLGLLTVAVARLTRRAAAGVKHGVTRASAAEIKAAGTFAALSTVTASTLLINGGSRFPHVYVAALFAVSLEATCAVVHDDLGPRGQWIAGAILGAATSLMLATRPGDGGMLGTGIFLYFVYSLVRRRVPWRAFAGAFLAFALFGGFTLITLRLQLGRWFTTGYSLTEDFHPWSKFRWSVPPKNMFRSGFPLAVGSYCWWPLAPALGIAGLACVRGRGKPIAFMLAVGTMALIALYTMQEQGRTMDWGYGPRYQLPSVVAMAVGGGVLLARLWRAAIARAETLRPLARAGPAALALAAAVVGVVRIAPLVYPYNHEVVHAKQNLFEAIRRDHLHNAIVFVTYGSGVSDARDVTQNWPLELYKNDVIVAIEFAPNAVKCMRDHYPDRRFYRTSGKQDISLSPL